MTYFEKWRSPTFPLACFLQKLCLYGNCAANEGPTCPQKEESLRTGVDVCGLQPFPYHEANLQGVELQIPQRQGHGLEFPEAASRSLLPPRLQPQWVSARGSAYQSNLKDKYQLLSGESSPNCRRTAAPLKTGTPRNSNNTDKPQSPRNSNSTDKPQPLRCSALESCLYFRVERDHAGVILLYNNTKND